ncbi:CASP-like protein 2B1 [Arachis duranensis]|uniref:CASP-like protein n=1 Tax=Arachis duranensis TaxID=130453 RepID=A0A6P4D429_ARADU|nr:CASP-like protein 2B1 [Arachis duranensis]
MSYLGVGVSPGTVPVYHSTNLKLLDKRIKIAELVLRFMILGLGVVAVVLIGTDSQVKVFFSFKKEAKFTDVKALVFLVVANGLAAGYSLIQGLRCVVSLVRGSVLFNKPLAWAIFSADQIMAYVTVSAVAGAGQSAVKVCNMYEKFCNQVGEGVASAVVACISMVLLSCISSFTLFRLYGPNKTKSAAW